MSTGLTFNVQQFSTEDGPGIRSTVFMKGCSLRCASLPHPPVGGEVATNILAFEAISYQAKGRWTARGNAGAIQISEVYAGGPPLPGSRVA